MSRKTITTTRPRKADLLAALRGFTKAVQGAGGILQVLEGEPASRKRDLASAYRKAARLLNEPLMPIIRETEDDYGDQAAFLLAKHARLIELARNRRYSTRALVGLVMTAAVSDQVQAL